MFYIAPEPETDYISKYPNRNKIITNEGEGIMNENRNINNFDAVTEQWLQYIQFTKKYSTYIKYQNIYEKYIRPLIGNRYTDEITTIECRQILERTYVKYREKTISQSTYNSVKIVLTQILNFAESPVSIQEIKKSFPTVCHNTLNNAVLTKAEQFRLNSFLLDKVDIYKIGVLVCLYTGLRLGEICALRIKDIDFMRKSIYVNQTVQRIKTNDEKGKTRLVISDPKTASSRREVPLCDFLLKLLLNHMPKTEYLLGNKPFEPRTYQYKLKQYFAALSIEGKHFHSLRHTFATNCIESGMDPKCLSEILGHADVNTTLNRYIHPFFDSKIYQINVFANTQKYAVEC